MPGTAGSILECILFKLLDVTVYLVKLFRNINLLWTMAHALAASDAVVRLAYGWNSSIVADKVRPAGLSIVFILLRL